MEYRKTMSYFQLLFVLLLFIQLFILSYISTCHSQQLSPAEKAWLINKGEIVFVSQTAYPPFEFIDIDQSRAGMSLELVRWIATEYGIKARFRDMSFEEAQQAVLAKKVDVLTSFFHSEDRDKYFDFTQMTWEVPALIFVDSERPDIIDVQDLQGKRIAMQFGDYAAEYLNTQRINYDLVPASSFADAVNLIVTGEADAVIGDKQIVLYHLFSNKLTKRIKSVGQPLYTGQNSMAFKEGATELQTILNKGIELARERGVFSTISHKWTGTSYNQSTPWYFQYAIHIFTILISILGLFCISLFWNTLLRRTVHRKTEDLRKSEAHLRTLLHSIPDLVWLKDKNGVYLSCNAKFEKFFGAKETEIIGKTDYEFIEKDLADLFLVEDQDVMATGKPCMNEKEMVFASDGHKEHLETIKNPMFSDDGNLIGVLGIGRDITVRKMQEEEKIKLKNRLQQSQKMESIGTLAGGIAHEFNNMLAIIMGNNDLIREELPPGSLARKGTEEIQIAGIRARDVVKQLLTFSRQGDAVKKVIDLTCVIQESIKLIRSSTPASIKIEHNLSADTYPIMGNDTQINQILINLCNNAVDALPEKNGIITIELLNETIDIQHITHQTKLPPGQYAKLIVSDNGTGMDTEILDRIFEPYFTTKDIGKGTGIGMAVVHGIVEKHCGAIIVNSKSNCGTTFTIFLPAHKDLLKQKTDAVDILPIGDECILYVDDEPSLATLGKRLLNSLGYTTESTTDPEKALDMVSNDPNKFDLLITDMAMPNMTGKQLVIETLKIRPNLPTIICTGYSAKISEKEAVDIEMCSYLMKPINKSELAKIVRKVLDGAKVRHHIHP